MNWLLILYWLIPALVIFASGYETYNNRYDQPHEAGRQYYRIRGSRKLLIAPIWPLVCIGYTIYGIYRLPRTFKTIWIDAELLPIKTGQVKKSSGQLALSDDGDKHV
jgi:hypothetical protein